MNSLVSILYVLMMTLLSFPQRTWSFVTPTSAITHCKTVLAGMSSIDESTTTSNPFDEYLIGTSKEFAIQDTVVGDGESAQAGDILTVGYEGRLLESDKKFDAGELCFKLGEGKVIPGWDRGLIGLKVGGKRTIKIPPSLAYGSRGAGDGVIPPNADLIFDCELKSISTGPVAEFLAATGIGLNPRTGFLVLFIASIILPKFGIGEQGFI